MYRPRSAEDGRRRISFGASDELGPAIGERCDVDVPFFRSPCLRAAAANESLKRPRKDGVVYYVLYFYSGMGV